MDNRRLFEMRNAIRSGLSNYASNKLTREQADKLLKDLGIHWFDLPSTIWTLASCYFDIQRMPGHNGAIVTLSPKTGNPHIEDFHQFDRQEEELLRHTPKPFLDQHPRKLEPYLAAPEKRNPSPGYPVGYFQKQRRSG
jgi:hypothetical protein